MDVENQDNTAAGRESQDECEIPSVTNEKVEEFEKSEAETKVKCDPAIELCEAQHSKKNDEITAGESEIKSVPSATNMEADELEERAAETEIKTDPVNECGDVEHSEKNNESTGPESEINSLLSVTEEKGETDEDKEVDSESSSNMSEQSMEESRAVKDTSPTSQTVSKDTKETDKLEERAAETEIKGTTMTPEDLLSILDDLETDELKQFKWYLNHPIQKSYEAISKSKLENAAMRDIVDILLNTYTREALAVTKKILNKMDRKDLVQRLTHTSSGPEGETDEVKEVNNERSSNMSEWSMKENDAAKDASRTSQTVSTDTKEISLLLHHPAVDRLEESRAKIEASVICVPPLPHHCPVITESLVSSSSSSHQSQSSSPNKVYPHQYRDSLCDPVNEPGDENPNKNYYNTEGESEIKSLLSVTKMKENEPEESTAKTEIDPVHGAKHSDNNDDSTRVGGESEKMLVIQSATKKKVKEVNNESSSNMSEQSMKESDTVKDTSPTSQTVSAVNKEISLLLHHPAVDRLEESRAKIEESRMLHPEPICRMYFSIFCVLLFHFGVILLIYSSFRGPTETVRDSVVSVEDLCSVSSRMTEEKRHSSSFTCRVQQDINQTRETYIHVPGGFSSQWIHVTVIFLGIAAFLGILIKCMKRPIRIFLRLETVNSGSCTEFLLASALDMDMSGNKDTQSMKISEEINKKKQHQRETETLFDRLHLQDKRQQKFTPADFLKIGPPVKQDHVTCEKDLVHTFLQRLMMLDYRARYIPVRQDSHEVSHLNLVPLFDTVETDDSDLDALYNTSADSDQSKQTHVHPLDVQMAVFHCSDSFFKQNMVTKLSQCQYALPLLVPDPVTMDIDCPLWTFRQIMKTWKINQIKDNKTTVTMKSMPICKAETPMVSFFRLGSLSLSKSQLMNSLINDRHNTFFHRNCPGSTKSRHLMDGVAEIAWYCPAGKPNDAFNDCIAFCNLHGDGLLIEKQRDILTEKSSVNVVLVPTLERGDKSATLISTLYTSSKPLIILIADSDCGAVQMKNGKYKMGLKDRNQSDVSEELKGIIRNILSGPHVSFQLETMAEVSGIRVDEDETTCQKGKCAAMEIVVNLLQGMDVSEIKNTFFPCQGKLWHEWCRTNKELHHLKGYIEKEKCEKQEKLKQIRQEQYTASCRELMKLFIESLSSLKSTDREYFLKWTQILIDAFSSDDLSSFLQSYDEKWSEVLALKKKHDKSDQLKRKQTELDLISTKLQSATFGLEHIFREMGQIYEAHASLKKQPKRGQTDWSKYPELAAEMMISGHPMELMDGDAGHVPLTWISSLLDEVIKKVGNKRVFVLSVLGVQSSGKSTMLNAMFGLQFAVSAGRCTKGAFMQLVKVSEEIKEDFQFDYILVVDTEGLRALELAGKAALDHDNELATFVVGLGNMTLINIFGENPADMQDVLQIVVQAFMRMKKVQLSPSCVFVHQNVTDIAAAEKNMDGKRCLQEKLDQMTQLAAKEEVCDAECFSDVIAFDVQKDVKYFAQLWEGSPPMAPPNPGYSESVQELKNFILSKASQSSGVTLSQFKSKIQDLWNALMNENFVFSFKNTLEIAVYRKLEVQYGNWTWALRSSMLTIENQLYTSIENGKLDKIELSYLHNEMSNTYEKIRNDLTTYFDDDKDKEMLVQWRGRFENKIKAFHDEQVRAVKRKLDEVIQQKNARKKLDDQRTEFENKLLQKSKELAHQLKDKAKDEEELKKQFDSVWSGWVRELTADTKPIEDINYDEDQFEILLDNGIESSLINDCKKVATYKNISKVGSYNDYVSLTKHQDPRKHSRSLNKLCKYAKDTAKKIKVYFKGSLQHEDQEMIRSLIDEVEKQSLDAIKNIPVGTRGYSPAYLQKVAKSVKEKLAEFESQRKYALKKEFTVDLLLYVFDRAESWLLESHKRFKMNYDALAYLESKKDQYYNIFRSFCQGSSSAVVLGKLVCEKLKSSTIEAVCNQTAIDLANEMKCNFPAFSGNRLNLEKHVLKSLAEKEDFDGFITYTRHPKKQVKTFIKEEVKNYIYTENKDKAQSILKKNVEDINKLVSQALFDATKKVKTQTGNTDMWVEEFSSLLRDKLTFTISCQSFCDINNFDFLKEEIEKGLKSIMKKVSSLSLDKMKEFRMKPDQILIDQLCNCCWVKCPFCAAVCTNTLKDHSPDKHNVPFHRPPGINGWHTRDTVELVVDFCTTSVASDRFFRRSHDSDETFPYKEFQKAGGKYATWTITPDESKLTYWKWFVCQFQTQIEDHYKLKFLGRGEIPSEWTKHSKQEAIESLDEMYNL